MKNMYVLSLNPSDSILSSSWPIAVSTSLVIAANSGIVCFFPGFQSLAWGGAPLHARLFALAEGISRGLARTIAAGRPVILMMEGDLGRTLGELLRRELDVASDIISIDGVELRNFDYVDIGEVIEPTNVVPLIIKSLLFSTGDSPGHG